jgi:hypothetical protein
MALQWALQQTARHHVFSAAALRRTATDPFTGETVNDAPLLTLIPEAGIAARVSACFAYLKSSTWYTVHDVAQPVLPTQ